jgi:hypothetical protein
MTTDGQKKTTTKVTANKKAAKKTAVKAREASAKKVSKKPAVSAKVAPAKKATKKTSIKPKEATVKKVAKRSTTTTKPQTSSINITSEERWKMIAIAAYHKAEQRGFAPGGEMQDWAEAEKEVDELLTSG